MATLKKILQGMVSEPDALTVKIQWKDSYSVNVRRIDAQHKRLLNTINDMKEWAEDDIPLKIIEHFIKLLSEYTVYHFTTEEKLMHDLSYPRLSEQKAEHKCFVEKIKLFREELSKKDDLDKEMLTFLINWFIDHIQKKDRHLGKFLNEKGIF